ncbi:5-oxoproline transporter, DUF979 family subunit [Atopobium sp. oral taxon 416]|uniref:5-oxoproline transporter, DUF979 family subunit n=1 Tax=Atopobium sp. oral taxon 416 TaxID=712157 RepID=UPI002111F4BC|nr:DUF979 family protein [Atopobium sp. oral taxon 416]
MQHLPKDFVGCPVFQDLPRSVTDQLPVGITVGVFVGIIVLHFMRPKQNTMRVYLENSRRMLDIVGKLIVLLTLLAILGSVFIATGIGTVISDIVGAIIPQGNMVVGIVVYCVGMALFTVIMGNAFAAITVMTVGIGAPFAMPLGVDPVIVGSLALTPAATVARS